VTFSEDHLLAWLHADARAELRGLGDQPRGDLRFRLSAVGRSLRDTRAGIPVHAAACETSGGRGLLIPGHSRSGKSTLSVALCVGIDARFVSDDAVWISEVGRASGFGRPATLRRGSPLWDLATRVYGEVDGDHLIVRVDDLGAPEPVPSTTISWIVFPRVVEGSPELRTISHGETVARLVTSASRPLLDAQLLTIARIVARVPSVEIEYSNVSDSVALCERVMELDEVSATTLVHLVDATELQSLASEVVGVRIDDEVVLSHGARGEVLWLREWSPGASLAVRNWDDLKART